MDNNNQQIEIDETDGLETSMQNDMESRLSSINYNYSIYKVPEFIRKEKEQCYRPLVVSIGPVYYQDGQLQTMEAYKWIILDLFLKNPNNACQTLDRYINMVRESQEEIREHYQENIMLTPTRGNEFIKMIVLDAIFLLSIFLLTSSKLPPRRLSIPREVLNLFPIMRSDLFLLENQVPFFVLKRIFNIAFPTAPDSSLIYLTHEFINGVDMPECGSGYAPIGEIKLNALKDAAHVLDFYWMCFCLPFHTHLNEKVADQTEEVALHLPRTAKHLSDAGVQFKVSGSQINPLHVTFNKRTGELQLPKLIIGDQTEPIWRSMLFFEQCHYNDMLKFAALVVFLNSLIKNVEDIHILINAGVFQNDFGSDEELVNLFRNLDKYTYYKRSRFNYASVSQQVNIYANKRRNRWRAILWRDYFNHPWAILSFIFAVIFFILTLLQTITAFTK